MTRMLQLMPTGTPAILPSRMFCSIFLRAVSLPGSPVGAGSDAPRSA